MPNFEQPPVPPPEPEQEPPLFSESKEQEAQGVMTRLGNNLRRWKDVYFAAVITGHALGTASDFLMKEMEKEQERARETAKSKKEHAPGRDVDVRFEELRALDPEASPERIRLILDTMPEGFVESEVISIGFTDAVLLQRPDYHLESDPSPEAAATAGGGTRAERTIITFWRGAKDNPSEQVWGGYLVHEIAHANDWENENRMDAAEGAELKAKVKARVMSEDRYRDAYVESIVNADPEIELENKAKEYWAQIVAAYLNGTLDPFGPDGELVREYIAKDDPDFDRDEALNRRRAVVREMAAEEQALEYAALPQAEREAVESWAAWRTTLEAGNFDPELQREGRREIVEAFKRWGATPEGERYLFRLVAYQYGVEGVYDARLKADAGLEKAYLSTLAERLEELEDARGTFPDADLARAEIEGIMRSGGVWIAGGEERGMKLLPGEYDRLEAEISSESLKYLFNSWNRPDHEKLSGLVADYVDRKVFTTPS